MQVKSDPANLSYQNKLAAAYIQKTRETTDYSYLDRAAKIVEQVLAHQKNDYEALRLRNIIELNRHNFSKVVEYARDMTRLAPQDSQNWGTLGDALMEMGEYNAAAEAYEKMVSLRPNLLSYNRMAYYRFVTGDSEGAIALMKEAIAAGASYPENTAWCLAELGSWYFKAGRLSEAEQAYSSAIDIFPAAHAAHAGLGSVQAAQGKIQAAIDSYKRAGEAVPLVPYMAALTDLYQIAGKKEEARKQIEMIDLVSKMEQAANQKANRTLALVYANQERNLERAMELAEADFAVRKDVYTYDALSWVLYKNKRYGEAQKASEQALKLGTPEPLFYYHAGMIAQALGNKIQARKHLERALSLNPKFDFRQAAVAEKILREIQEEPGKVKPG